MVASSVPKRLMTFSTSLVADWYSRDSCRPGMRLRRPASLASSLAGRRPDGRAPTIPTANEWSSTLQKRPTALVVIYSAATLHLVEAFILAQSKAADNSIPMASLLDAFGGRRITLTATMLLSALLALSVAVQRPGFLAIFTLIPQQTLLLITAIGAVAFAAMGHYADGYQPSGGGLFIGADQLPRILLAISHSVASYQWFWIHDRPRSRGKKSTVDNILAEASWASLADDREDDLLVIPVDELREIVESHL